MRLLTGTLVADGSSDRLLKPILDLPKHKQTPKAHLELSYGGKCSASLRLAFNQLTISARREPESRPTTCTPTPKLL